MSWLNKGPLCDWREYRVFGLGTCHSRSQTCCLTMKITSWSQLFKYSSPVKQKWSNLSFLEGQLDRQMMFVFASENVSQPTTFASKPEWMRMYTTCLFTLGLFSEEVLEVAYLQRCHLWGGGHQLYRISHNIHFAFGTPRHPVQF